MYMYCYTLATSCEPGFGNEECTDSTDQQMESLIRASTDDSTLYMSQSEPNAVQGHPE